MSNLEVLAILGVIIIALLILIPICLCVADRAHGFTPNQDPKHRRHRSKKDAAS